MWLITTPVPTVAQSASETNFDLPTAIFSLESEANREQLQVTSDVFAPIVAVGTGYLFFDGGALIHSGSHRSTYAGFAFRQPLRDASFWGFYSYADWRYSQANNDFYGFGMGGELRLKWLEIHGHYHLPINDDPELLESFQDIQNYQSVSRQISSRSIAGEIFPTGHTLQIPVTRIVTTTTTTRDTQVVSQFERYEAPREFYEVEAGVPIIPRLNAWAYGGYYQFNSPLGGDDVAGFRGRIAARPAPALEFGVSYYQDGEEIYGSEWTGSVSVSLPLGAGKGSWKDRFKFSAQSPSFLEKLSRPIVRNHYIPTQVGELELVDQTIKTVVKTKSTSRSTTLNEILKRDIIFVRQDDPEANDANPGTWQLPKLTVVDGGEQAEMNFLNTNRIWTVWTEYSVNPYTDQSVNISESAHFTSSFVPWTFNTSYGLKVFGGNTPRPVLDGTSQFIFSDNAINSLQGYALEHDPNIPPPFEASIVARNIGDLVVELNTINVASNRGIYVINTAPIAGGHAVIRHNFLTDMQGMNPTDGAIVAIAENNLGVPYRVEIDHNQIRNAPATNGILVQSIAGLSPTSLEVVIDQNEIGQAGTVLNGISLTAQGVANGNAAFLDAHVSQNAIGSEMSPVLENGILIDLLNEDGNSPATLTGSLTGNTVYNAAADTHSSLSILSFEDTTLGAGVTDPFLVSDNLFVDTTAYTDADRGVVYIENLDGIQHLRFERNTVVNLADNAGSGIHLFIDNLSADAVSTYDFLQNEIIFAASTNRGISAYINTTNMTDDFQLNFVSNQVLGIPGGGGVMGDGISLELDGVFGAALTHPIAIQNNAINPLQDGDGNFVQGDLANGISIDIGITNEIPIDIVGNSAFGFAGVMDDEGNGLFIASDAISTGSAITVTGNFFDGQGDPDTTGIRIDHGAGVHKYFSDLMDQNQSNANVLVEIVDPATVIGDLYSNGMDFIP